MAFGPGSKDLKDNGDILSSTLYMFQFSCDGELVLKLSLTIEGWSIWYVLKHKNPFHPRPPHFLLGGMT